MTEIISAAASLEFTRSDNAVKKLRPAIWYFGGVAQVFIKHFGLFGNLFFPAKKPADEAGNEISANKFSNILAFKEVKINEG